MTFEDDEDEDTIEREGAGLATFVSPTGDAVTYALQGKGVTLKDIEAGVREAVS